MRLDARHRRIRLLVAPDCVHCLAASGWNAVVAAVAFVRAVGGVLGALQFRHIHIRARYIEGRGIAGFLKAQSGFAVGNHLPRDLDHDVPLTRRDRYRVIRTGDFFWSCVHGVYLKLGRARTGSETHNLTEDSMLKVLLALTALLPSMASAGPAHLTGSVHTAEVELGYETFG